MPQRVIYDSAEPVVIRSYPNESLAALDQAVLSAADIPATIRQNPYPITHQDLTRVQLAVRREDVKAALELLGDTSAE
jgi:hypothetical protein